MRWPPARGGKAPSRARSLTLGPWTWLFGPRPVAVGPCTIRLGGGAAALAGLVIGVLAAVPTLLLAHAVLIARLPEPGSRAPTRLYVRPFTLEVGAPADRDAVERHLERVGYLRARGGEVRPGEYALASRRWTIDRRPFRVGAAAIPGGATQVGIDGGRIAAIEDASGSGLTRVVLEPEPLATEYGSAKEDRVPVPLADVPARLVAAVLTVEDRRFYRHSGLDLRRIAAAAIANARAGRIVEGGSTLTQQLAKNLYLTPRRTLLRKAREAAIAIVLEARHSKDEILEAYLNEVYLGQAGAVAVHGVGSAARHYFGKDVRELDLAESALLAGLIRGPSLYSPFRDPEAAKERRDFVLGVLRERGIVGEESWRAARGAPLGVRDAPRTVPAGRWFADWVGGRLASADGEERLPERGLTVITTLDGRLQRAAAEAVREGLDRLTRDVPAIAREEEGGASLQAALVALDPATGEVLALVGGRDYGRSQFNRAVEARRQPGSAFKPIVLLAAVSGEEPAFTLASVIDDEPLEVRTPAGVWRPANYDRTFRGPVTLREALERSLNVPFARVGLTVGPERIASIGRRLGIGSPLAPVPSLALGASEVTPLELTRAYAAIASEGRRSRLRTTLAVLDGRGRRVAGPGASGEAGPSAGGADPEPVVTPAQTYLVTSALRGAVERGTGQAMRRLGFYGDVAAKSGTTNDWRDAWFLGYTPGLAVGVWVGFDDGRSVGLVGSQAALPIFTRFLIEAVGPYGTDGPYGSQGFTRPDGVEIVEVDPLTGRRAGPGCPGIAEVFLEGTAPEESCSPFWWTRDGWGAGDSRRLERALRGLDADRARELGRMFESLGRDILRALEREARLESGTLD